MPNLSPAERRWIIRHSLIGALLGLVAVALFILEFRLLDHLVGNEPGTYPWLVALGGAAALAGIAFGVNHRFRVKFRGADPQEGHQPGLPMWGVTGNVSGAPASLISYFQEAASLATDLHQAGFVPFAEKLRQVIHEPVEIPRLSVNLLRELELIRSGLPDRDAPLYGRVTSLIDSLETFIAAEEARGAKKWRYGA